MAEVGLSVDLTKWKQNMGDAERMVREALSPQVLTPFQRKLDSMADSFGKSWTSALGSLKSQFMNLGGLLSGVTIGAVAYKALDYLKDSYEAANAYEDSLSTLKAALNTLGDGLNVPAVMKRVETLGERLRDTLGVSQTKTNKIFGDFITRGLGVEEAERASILAANYAQKTGKDVEEVAKIIADAANGSVKAIRSLGVSVEQTGNKARDGRAAIEALLGSYGNTGADLVDPLDRVNASLEGIRIEVGKRVAPAFDKAADSVNKFLIGMESSADGKRVLDEMGRSVSVLVDQLGIAVTLMGKLMGPMAAGTGAAEYITGSVLKSSPLQLVPGIGKEIVGLGQTMKDGGASLVKMAQAMGRNAVTTFTKKGEDQLKAQQEALDKKVKEGGTKGFATKQATDATRRQEDAKKAKEMEDRLKKLTAGREKLATEMTKRQQASREKAAAAQAAKATPAGPKKKGGLNIHNHFHSRDGSAWQAGKVDRK